MAHVSRILKTKLINLSPLEVNLWLLEFEELDDMVRGGRWEGERKDEGDSTIFNDWIEEGASDGDGNGKEEDVVIHSIRNQD